MNADRRPAALCGAVLGWSASLTPGALPRSAAVVTTAGTVCAAVGLLIGLLSAAVFGRVRRLRLPGIVRVALGVYVAAVLCAAVVWEERLRSAMDLPPAGPLWVLGAVAVPATVIGLVAWIPWRRLVIGGVVALMTLLGTPGSPAHAAPDVPDSPLVHYAGLDGRADTARAVDLVARWRADGGAHQRAVVVAVPTGSGWVDGGAVRGFDERFGGSVRVLAVQYSAMPSWQAYVRSPERAGQSATALVAALSREIGTLPPGQRPRVYLYGQSLGATGAQVARRWAHEHRVPLAGTVLVGVPGGGASCRDDPSCVVLNNPSDPVAALSWSLLWRPPARNVFTGEAGPRPPWVPGLSLLATVIDLVGSRDVPAGFGHRYGTEQGLVAPIPSDPGSRVRAQPSRGPRADS
ncbi:alpha/beta hydrolase [Gordonia sp. PP30]|uniref:alpha/beta-hydrolase family protein n=1 Tax=unclassified Gordonia (in: high G+C Gram-positive bacteria) TaxID=2657482 RepID=UPI001FFF2EEF|nr:alpha/beta-hydrolase family protein [Gordonia sp. PP30]UQE73962.1 alpha/beta hydrolase [Gordonia sp. PP30]